MMRGNLLRTVLPAAFAAGLAASPALAQSHDWFVHVGPGRLDLVDGAEVRAGGAVVPGAGISTEAQYTGIVEIGRFIAPDIAMSLTLGGPPLVEIDGAGSLEGLGRLADVRYGPSGLTAQWHPLRQRGRFSPYVGAGLTYMHIFSTRDAALTDVEVDDDIGPLIQGGVEYYIGERVGIFADVKKGWLRTRTTGSLAGTPIEADVKLDPFVMNAGVAFRF